MNLYEIAHQLRAVLSRVDDDGVIPDDAIEELDALNGDLADKIDGVAKYRSELLAEAAAVGEEAARLKARQKAAEARAERYRKWLGEALGVLGQRKVKTTTHTVSLRKNPARVEITGSVPGEFMTRPDPVPDKKAIRELLGKVTQSWAHLEQSESVQIR